MACTDRDCFLPDGGLPGMKLPRPSSNIFPPYILILILNK